MNKKTRNGLIVAGVIAAAVYLMARSSKKGGNGSGGGSGTAGGGGNQPGGGSMGTTPGLNFIQMANDLFASMDGCGTNWDDGPAGGVTSILGKLNNQRDYTALNEAYGVRTISCLFMGGVTGNMEACLKSELDNSEMEEVKQMLALKGIQTQL